MLKITRNIDLNDGTVNRFNGWEQSAAVAFDTVIYTGNWFAAFSGDGGNTFNAMDPWGICRAFGELLCCDQVVIYIQQINQFAWIMQTDAGNYVLSLASPDEIRRSKGTQWTTWLIPANRFGDQDERADFPEAAVGSNFLYLAFNLTKAGHSVVLRLSLEELSQRKEIHLIYFAAPNSYLRPAQNTGDTGYFATHKSDSELRIFIWPETSDVIEWFDIEHFTIPTEDWTVKTPSTDTWLDPNSKIGSSIRGGTRTGTQLWLAWSGARKVSGQEHPTFDYPHIGIAVIDVFGRNLVEQRFIWNPEYAFAWPSLATNSYGDVGLSFCWGGSSQDPQFGVGILTGPDQMTLVLVTNGQSTGAGGHYTTIRSGFPNSNSFCSAGGNQFTSALINHPHFVLFEVSQGPSIEVHTERHQLGGWVHVYGRELGGWVHVYGRGFTPYKEVRLYAEGLKGHGGALAIGFINVDGSGSFSNFVYDARCWPGQTEAVTIRAVDSSASGRMATGTTYGFVC